MSKPSFRFQRFAVADDRCGMKVGTDAVLLGAWANVAETSCILDIGTGSGIIAMMLAQRTESWNARVEAIDIEREAAKQAAENFSASPWPNRLSVSRCSLQDYLASNVSRRYDLCVCNPPYFQGSYPARLPKKQIARQGESLTARQLFLAAKIWLSDHGRISLVLPFDQLEETVQIAADQKLSLVRQTTVRPTALADPKRVLLEFSRDSHDQIQVCDELIIERARHDFTPEYAALTQKFHLRYASL